jgi:hypothetical protein
VIGRHCLALIRRTSQSVGRTTDTPPAGMQEAICRNILWDSCLPREQSPRLGVSAIQCRLWLRPYGRAAPSSFGLRISFAIRTSPFVFFFARGTLFSLDAQREIWYTIHYQGPLRPVRLCPYSRILFGDSERCGETLNESRQSRTLCAWTTGE